MASHHRLVIVLVFMISIEKKAGANEETTKSIKCDFNKNQYFHWQMRKCKKCDRCPEGYGIEQKITFEGDPVHGALGCRKCKPCILKETYKKKASYKQCKACRNCTANGELEIRSCTTSRNSKCGPKSEETENEIQEKSTQVAKEKKTIEPTQKGSDAWVLPTVLIGVALVVLIAAFIAVIFCVWKYLRNPAKCTYKNIKGQSEKEIPEIVYCRIEDKSLTTDGPDIDVSHKPFEDELPDKECMLIAKQWVIDHQYRSYAPLLGITRSEVEILEDENPNNEEQASYLILDKWKKKNGRRATKSVLRTISEEFKNPPDLKSLLKS